MYTILCNDLVVAIDQFNEKDKLALNDAEIGETIRT